MMKTCALVLLLCAAPALAQVSAQVNYVGAFNVAGGIADAYTVTLTGTPVIAAFELTFSGQMYQFGQFLPPVIAITTPLENSPGIPADIPQADTHFLFTAAELAGSIVAPNENNDFRFGQTRPALLIGEGIGTTLAATVALLPAVQASTFELANIALWRGAGDVTLLGSVSDSLGNIYPISATVPQIPEPMSLLLLAAGSLLLRRRR